MGITFIYVTHDQEEALTMSDRIAVMSDGRVEQIGPPREIYEEPARPPTWRTSWVCPTSWMRACEGSGRVALGEFELQAAQGSIDARGEVKLTIRPERIQLGPHSHAGPNVIPGMVERTVYLGNSTQIIVNLAPGQRIQVVVPNEGDAVTYQSGAPVSVCLPREALRVLS